MMKKTKKLLALLCASICVTGTVGVLSGCEILKGLFPSEETATLAFKDNFPTNLTLNVSVDISQYVEYEKGQSLTMTAEYTDANGVKKSYETFGTSFMPTELGEVTITVTLKDTNISISKTVPVKVSAPKVLSSETVIRFRGEEFALDGLKEGLNVLAPNNEYTFKALKATLLGGDEVIDFSGLTTYTFVNAGTYEVKYEVYNDGGSTEGTLLVFSKRVLTENETEDLSNYGEGVVAQASSKVVVDEEDKAENSDWSYVIWADSSATGVDVFDYAPTYWTNYGVLELEGGIDLSRYYLEFDVKFSKDSRELFAIRMVDETQTTASGEKIVSREGEADENGEYAWQHVSMKDMYKYGTYQYLRIVVMHPLTSDSSSYDVNNVFVKIDNVKLCEYDVPYEYHESINYVKTDADYTAQEGEFEEEVTLWENMDDSGKPTYLAQDGAYTNEVTEFNFTIDDAAAEQYRFVLGARVADAGSYNDGVYLDFRRDYSAAFFAVYAPEGLKSGNNVDAQHCYFTSGHNYTATFGVIDNTVSLWIYDNTSNQIVLEYEYLLQGVTIPENGGFGFWSYENINVACKKPHIYVKPQDPTEITVTQLSLGSLNSATAFDVMIGNGTLQQVFVSDTNNLASADGTFGTTSTWNDRKFQGQVGVIGFTRTAFRFFPTGTPAPQKGDKLTVPEGATIIVEGYTVIFGEAFELWYNGETWQTEYVEAPEIPVEPEDPNKVTMITLEELDARTVYSNGMYQLYFKMDITQNGVTWGGWDNSAKVMFNDAETKADGWCFASSGLLYVQLTTADEANPLTIVKGTALTINGKKYEIANDYNIYYYDGAWQTEAKAEAAEVTISNFSFGTNNAAGYFDLVIGEGALQNAIVNYGQDLTHLADCTFGTESTWESDTTNIFKFFVGVLASSAKSFQIFPTGHAVKVGDKLTIPQGATITVGEYTAIFGETFEAWFNGETWQTEYVEAPEIPVEPEDPNKVTMITVMGLKQDSTVYANGMYQIYLNMDITQSGATWGGWDNSASVSLNGADKVADGWCFATDTVLYVQVTTVEEANPLIIKKGTALTINGKKYEIAEDVILYYYDGAWQTEAKAEATEVTISGFSLGSQNNKDRIDIVIGSGALQTTIATCTSNLSSAEGTFGTLSTWNNNRFHGMVGVLPNGTNGLIFFPSGATAAIGDKITVPEGAIIIVNGYTAIFGETLELWYNGESWQTEEVQPLPPAVTEVTISEIAYLASNVEFKTLNFSSTNGSTVYKWSSTTALYNGTETNVSIVWETAEMFQVGTGKDWVEGDIFTLKAGATFEQNGITYKFEKDYSVYYYDGEWHTEAKASTGYISNFTIGATNSGNQIDILIGNGTLPESFAAAGDLRGDAAFTAAAQWNDQSFAGKVGVLGNGNTFNFFPPSGQAKLGDKITVAQGTTITIGEDVVTFGEKLELWFNGTSWQMTEPVIVSGFTFGENNKAGYFDIVPTSGSIPAEIVSSGTNLSTADGTFGKSSTWTRDGGAKTVKFPGQVGVLASAAQNFQIFPTGATAAAGDVITIPEGASIIVNGYSVVFGETLTVTFNGTTWEGLGAAQPDPTTMLTITRFSSSRTGYEDNTYKIYVYTDVTNDGTTWGGWDNKSNVSLNGADTRADWCFASSGENAVLYIQVAPTEDENSITIKKGTILTINNTRYEIAEDFNLYYYDGAFHAEPQV